MIMRDNDPNLFEDDDRPEVQVYVATDGLNYQEFDVGLFRLIERYDGGQEEYVIEIRRPVSEGLIIESQVKRECNFQREQTMVITWHDDQQTLLNEVGISFLNRATCDFYWKKICKILNLDLIAFESAERLQVPSEDNFDTLLTTIKKDQDLINHYILYSQSFKAALWETFDSLRQHQAQEGVRKIQTFMKTLLRFPDKYILEALVEGPNFEHFLKLYQKRISLNLYKVYQESINFSTFVQFSQSMEKDIELIERVRFLKFSVLTPGDNLQMQHELDRLSNKARVHFIESFIKEKICQKTVKILNQSSNNAIVAERFYQFYSQYFITFVPIEDPKLKTKIFKDFLDSGLLEAAAKIIQLNNYKVLQLFFNLATDNEALFNEIYFQEIQRDQLNSLHSSICSKFIHSQNQQAVTQCLIFFEGFTEYFERNPSKLVLFSRVSLPIIFSGCQKNPLRVLSFINLYIKSFEQIQSLSYYIISSGYYQILVQKLSRNQLKKYQMIDIVFIVKANLMTYGSYFVNFKTHLFSTQSLERQLPQIDYSVYSKAKKYCDELAKYTVDSGLLIYFLEYLKKHIHSDNMVNSAILSLVKIATMPMKYNQIIRAIREFDFQIQEGQADGRENMSVRVLRTYMKKLRKIQVPTLLQDRQNQYNLKIRAYQQQLESQREQNYLMRDTQNDRNTAEMDNFPQLHSAKSDEERDLLRMRQEMKRERQEELIKEIPESKPEKKVKKDNTGQVMSQNFTFNFQFPEE